MGWVKNKGKSNKFQLGGRVPRGGNAPNMYIPGVGEIDVEGTQTLKKGGKVDRDAKKAYRKAKRQGKIGPDMKEALLHKAGLKKSKTIERGLKKQPEKYKGYKPFRQEKKERRKGGK